MLQVDQAQAAIQHVAGLELDISQLARSKTVDFLEGNDQQKLNDFRTKNSTIKLFVQCENRQFFD